MSSMRPIHAPRLDRASSRQRSFGRTAGRTVLALVAAVCTACAGSAQHTSSSMSSTAGSTSGPSTSTSASTTSTSTSTVPGSGIGASASADWTVYHDDVGGSGAGPTGLKLSHVTAAWTSPTLDGDLYGEPLVWDKTVYVATENDTVYALSASTGSIVWSRHLGTPVPSSALPCGNISPDVGITSTPVIDPARKELFTVADEWVGGNAHHELYGISAATGAVELRQDADPAGADTTALLQRASLTLDRSHVVFGFGGNYGDCSTYHGWVESAPEAGGAAKFFEVDSGAGEDQGAIWMGGGAPVVASNGDIWVAAGNGSVTSSSGPYDDSDSVLELSSSLRLLQFFAPSDWYSDNASDYDLGSSVPAVLPNGLVVQAGKSRTAYLLKAASLGGIGGQREQTSGFCGNDVDGGIAFSGTTVYLPCENGVIAVATSAATGTMNVLWQTATGAGGPPILAGGMVWSIGNGTLYALSHSTGEAEEQLSIGSSATDFPTPSVGDGMVLATSARQVHAFAGS
jgi:outer membrane protein assembly factor BamB